MEETTKTYINEDVKNGIETMSLFLWKVKNISKGKRRTKISFERDQSDMNYNKIIPLEKRWFGIKKVSLVPVIVTSILTLIFFTIFLILAVTIGKTTELYILFLSSCLPGIVFFILTFVFYFIAMSKTKKAAEANDKEMREVLKEIKAILAPNADDENQSI